VKNFQPGQSGFEIELEIRHPFESLPEFHAFDVRGTVFLDGSKIFPSLGIRASSLVLGDAYLSNPDGYTTVFNPTNYSDGGFFGYSHGKLVPKNMPAPNATLGAFKAYYSDGQSENDGGRRALFPGDKVSRVYKIVKGESGPLKFGYVIDACWEPPFVNPPSGPDDFPANANSPEPFRLDIATSANSLSIQGGGVIVTAIAHDHQSVDNLFQGILEAPGLTDELIYDNEPEILDDKTAQYTFYLTNKLGNANPLGEEILVMVVHDDSDPNLGLIPSVGFAMLEVASENQGPKILSIEPSSGDKGSTVETVIFGSNFKPGATVKMYQSVNWISGYNVTVKDEFTIEAMFDLSAPIGQYTVYVENPGGLWGEKEDAFEILPVPTECSTAFHTDTLGTGTINGTCADQYDVAFLVDGPFEGRMLAVMQHWYGHSMVSVDVDTTIPSDPIQFPDALGGVGWLNPWTIDVDEFSGNIFISWVQKPTIVEVYSSSGEPISTVEIEGEGKIRALDTDGMGGFWVAFHDTGINTSFVYYYRLAGDGTTFLLASEIELDPIYGRVEGIAVIPNDLLFVLFSGTNGTILTFNVMGASTFHNNYIDNIFPAPLQISPGSRAAGIEIDQTDQSQAGCRIVVMGNQGADSSMVVKLDRNLNVLAQVPIPQSFQSFAINPDSDISVHHITMFPAKTDPCTYRLLETPAGW